MPNIKSAKKRVRSNAKKEVINNTITASMRTAVKNFEKSVKAGDKEKAATSLNIAIQRIDKAKSSGLVHQNKAARLKSRLTKAKNTME
ncbi:MAG: 30S ribosomal protein S20 [Bacilli bacterium]|nr:30S ribosomal protein S20 [Bacilli bacterium]